jgi:hypothetical protein
VFNPGLLGKPGCLSLGGSSRRHERDESITYGLLHRVRRSAIELKGIDHGSDDHPFPHELADRVADILVISSEAIHPPDNQNVVFPQKVEKPPPLWTVGQPGGYAGHAMIRHNLIDLEACGLRLGALMFNRLVGGRHTGVQDRLHGTIHVRKDHVRRDSCPLMEVNPNGLLQTTFSCVREGLLLRTKASRSSNWSKAKLKVISGAMNKFSLIYGHRGEINTDSSRMRRRLFALFRRVEDDDLADVIEEERGVEVPTGHGTEGLYYKWDRFFIDAERDDVLDTVSLHFRLLKQKRRQSDAAMWLREVGRIFKEENVSYRVADDGIVHLLIDEEFEGARQASIEALQAPRYANVLANFEQVVPALDQVPPNGKEAIRATFLAAEALFRLMFDDAKILGTGEMDRHLRSFLDRQYAGQYPALQASMKLYNAFKEWVAGAHNYRHEHGHEEVVQPPLELAVVNVATGAAFIRWLAELERKSGG